MRTLILILFLMSFASAQTPPIEPGVSHDLAKWRAAHYSDVRYKLDLTLEKMSPVLKGAIEIRVKVRHGEGEMRGRGDVQTPIILDWRKIKGYEGKSTVSNVTINGKAVVINATPPGDAGGAAYEDNEHLIFRDGVTAGENVIKLDFTSPLLTSGSAITRYVDKEDGAEYIYSLFVPSDASTAFPVFDQPDLKARFTLMLYHPEGWEVISNSRGETYTETRSWEKGTFFRHQFVESKPISTYVFAFAAGPFERVDPSSFKPASMAINVKPELKEAYKRWLNTDVSWRLSGAAVEEFRRQRNEELSRNIPSDSRDFSDLYVRRSQLAKFKPHAAEVFRLNREAIKYLEEYFDYKFPFPKYDLVLIPEFPFGGMEHAGATFLRESSVIFPSEPTANDHISRANLIFHEAAHQWFGDTVTMRWFDDLWLKEGFAEFMAYKTLERVMRQYNAWKAFYERNKPLAYQTDSTRGTTPIYQPIANLNSAKSAYGNIVYRKAPSFLKQAEFYLAADKFQTAVRAFLRKHEFKNAGWEDLVREFEDVAWLSDTDMMFRSLSSNDQKAIERTYRAEIRSWANYWVRQPGVEVFYMRPPVDGDRDPERWLNRRSGQNDGRPLATKFRILFRYVNARGITDEAKETAFGPSIVSVQLRNPFRAGRPTFIFPNYQDYGYGIFLLDDKSRDYILKNIQNEKDDFLRSMMWGALWDSVREGELDPREYVELAIKNIGVEKDELTIQTILGRVSTAMTYYVPDSQRDVIAPRLETMLIGNMRTAPALGQRITYYRAFLHIASSENARKVLKQMLRQQSEPGAVATGAFSGSKEKSPLATASGSDSRRRVPPGNAVAQPQTIPLKTKDRFDIVTKLASLGDPDAAKLLADLEKTETTDDAKRYAYAAKAAFPTRETKEKYWNDFVAGKNISESWIEAAFGPFNSVRHADLTLPYLERALKELPNHKRNRKIFFVNGWLAAFIGGQKSEEALAIVNKFLADNPDLDRDLRLKILENVDIIERAVKIRSRFATR